MSTIAAEAIFQQAVAAGCSDVHIKPGSPPKMRKHGKLIAVPGYEAIILDGELTERLTQETMNAQAFSQYQNLGTNQLDYSYDLPLVGRFRMNASKSRGLDSVVGRLLQSSPKTLDELEVADGVKHLANSKSGLIIVSGATGSGKSTTMAGIIHYINTSQPVHIISIEDPIEILHSDAMASISQREVGVDVDSFDLALEAALRQDPDVILIGEIRTAATLKTALVAADTGHLVITTLHTTDAAKAINRIIALYPAEERDLARQQLAAVLKGVVAQRLVPDMSGGRTVVNEILLNTPEMVNAILGEENETVVHDIITKSPSMLTFEECFVQKVEAGKIDLEVAKQFSLYPEYYDTVTINVGGVSIGGVEPKQLPPIPGFTKLNPSFNSSHQTGKGLPASPLGDSINNSVTLPSLPFPNKTKSGKDLLGS